MTLGHGMTTKCFLRNVLSANPAITRQIIIDNTSVTVLSYSDADGWKMMHVNGTPHL